ncbi:LysR family transcriptional regulator substrate-binding protein [Corynebacterium camporealensis]|uniref:LysR family transcriptional regulator substrate-binding protein n=1 Tax=Corynebacterium camporealensis TaxID=161896 RepID=UPI0034CF57BC
MLRLAFATGTEPGKWFRRYRENTAHGLETIDADDAFATLLEGNADLALARVPVDGGDPRADDNFHRVRLYEEAPGVAVPKDSIFAEVGEDVEASDLADEHVNYRLGDDAMVNIPDIRTSLQVVGANVGIVIAPRPLLKVLSKKQVVPLGLNDPTVPLTEIVLLWRKDDDCDAIQDFVGIAKGRTANSSRQQTPKKKTKKKPEKRATSRKNNSLPKCKKGSHRGKRRR